MEIDMVYYVSKIDMVWYCVSKIDMVWYVSKIDIVWNVSEIEMVWHVSKIEMVWCVSKIEMQTLLSWQCKMSWLCFCSNTYVKLWIAGWRWMGNKDLQQQEEVMDRGCYKTVGEMKYQNLHPCLCTVAQNPFFSIRQLVEHWTGLSKNEPKQLACWFCVAGSFRCGSSFPVSPLSNGSRCEDSLPLLAGFTAIAVHMS